MRLRVRWVMLGTTLGVAPALLYSFTMASADAGHLISAASVQHMVRLYTLATLGLAAIPLTFVYAILADRLMGIRVAISTGIQYLAARRVFQVLTLLPAIPVASYLWSHRAQPLAESLSRPVVFVPLALSAMLLIARKELLDLFDRLLCRMRGDHQRIMQDLLEALFDQHSAGAIAEATAERLQRALRPERLVIYCGESDVPVLPRAFATSNVPAPFVMARDGELAGVLSERGPAFLNASFAARLSASECAWIPQSGLVLAVPIAGELRAELAGIILLGAKSSGDPYWATDLDLLEDTARQVYLALKMRDVEKARDRAVRERELAEESERTRAEFLAQISHELRNPLHGVVGLTDLLLGTPLSEEQKSYTELIRRSSEWTVAIANDIVNLPALDLHTVPLNRVAFEWVALLEDFAVMAAEWGREPDVEVVLQIDLDAPLMTRSDPQRVRQVVLNLLVNAVKFTERGWVLLHAGRGQSASGSETMVITVEDTGPGIAHEFRDKLFQPFERSAAGSGPSGTGLGLAISKRLAHALGGDLTYEPRTGGGARFRFILPAAADRSQLPVETKPLEGVRILVVDSLPVRMWGTCLSLAALGASPTGSVSPSDPSVDNQHDLVILAGGDSRDAVHAIREVRRSHTGAPILLLHRGNGRLGQDDVEALGNIEQLHRPAPRNVLLGAIERCLAPPSDRAAFPESEDLSKDACTGIRILVVEDDPATANIHVMMLRWLGCTVRTTSAALDALAMLESEEWDAVFVDGKLAGMDGFELTRSIRRLRGAVRAIPVIAVCGDAGSLSRIQFFEAGADDYLVKPATAAAFRQVIQTRVVPRLRARTHRANEAWR
jgi:signal transduction histidine kinase/CheY-like chemotaxis protein